MKSLFSPKYTKRALTLLAVLLMVKILWMIVSLMFLSTEDIDEAKKPDNTALYYRVKLTPSEASAPKKVAVVKTHTGTIKEITLLAIYNTEAITVVTVVFKGKNKVLASGEEINGFTLKGARNAFALFTKEGKTYEVPLKNRKKHSRSSLSNGTTHTSQTSTLSKMPEGEVKDVGDYKIVDRSLLEHYAQNMDDIYKNIGIVEVKEGKNIVGFKVTFVRRNTPFSQLGIRRNDVIKSINGQALTSYAAAMDVYKNIQEVSNLSMVIMRGKKEMELEYEIN